MGMGKRYGDEQETFVGFKHNTGDPKQGEGTQDYSGYGESWGGDRVLGWGSQWDTRGTGNWNGWRTIDWIGPPSLVCRADFPSFCRGLEQESTTPPLMGAAGEGRSRSDNIQGQSRVPVLLGTLIDIIVSKTQHGKGQGHSVASTSCSHTL